MNVLGFSGNFFELCCQKCILCAQNEIMLPEKEHFTKIFFFFFVYYFEEKTFNCCFQKKSAVPEEFSVSILTNDCSIFVNFWSSTGVFSRFPFKTAFGCTKGLFEKNLLWKTLENSSALFP